MKRHHRKLNKWIDGVAVLMFVIALGLTAKASVIDSLSLEQELRCGRESHVHTDACYPYNVLDCGKPEHIHSTNCYLVLMEENQIDVVLEETDSMPEKTLEAVIQNAVDTALVFHHEEVTASVASVEEPSAPVYTRRPAAKPAPLIPARTRTLEEPEQEKSESVPLDNASISMLNLIIQEDEDIPELVLNENLSAMGLLFGDAEALDEDALLSALEAAEKGEKPEPASIPAMAAAGGLQAAPMEASPVLAAEPRAVGDQPVSSRANIYLNINGTTTCIGNLGMTTSNRQRNISVSDLNNLLNSVSINTLTYGSNYSVRVSTSLQGTYSNVTTSNQRIVLGSQNYNTYYVRIYSGNSILNLIPVTLQYPDGTTQIVYCPANGYLDLSKAEFADYSWFRDAVNTDNPVGDSVRITSSITLFAKKVPISAVTVNYDLNFPTIQGVTVQNSEKPTISTGATQAANTYSYSTSRVDSISILDVSKHIVLGKVNNQGFGLSRAVKFLGWQIEGTDVILTPGTSLSWDAIDEYAHSSKTLNLKAVWEQSPVETVSFYIRYNSVAVDIDGDVTSRDSNLYTPELFATFVEGLGSERNVDTLQRLYGIADTTADNSYTADQNIRLLEGRREEGAWLPGFPDDEDVFLQLRQYATHLEVDGIPVKAEDLNSAGYAIRWYVFKCQSDAWHVDGKLVRKQGTLEVRKTFAGNRQAVNSFTAQGDEYWISVNGSRMGSKILNLANATPQGNNVYSWEIDNMYYGEQISIAEHNYEKDGYRVFTEYSVEDASGQQSTIGTVRYEGNVELQGMTYATDTGLNERMVVKLTNVYYSKDSIILKKVDGRTGNALAGATFTLFQEALDMQNLLSLNLPPVMAPAPDTENQDPDTPGTELEDLEPTDQDEPDTEEINGNALYNGEPVYIISGVDIPGLEPLPKDSPADGQTDEEITEGGTDPNAGIGLASELIPEGTPAYDPGGEDPDEYNQNNNDPDNNPDDTNLGDTDLGDTDLGDTDLDDTNLGDTNLDGSSLNGNDTNNGDLSGNAENTLAPLMGSLLGGNLPADVDPMYGQAAPLPEELLNALSEDDGMMQLTFFYDEATGAYVYDIDGNGPITEISATNGFYEVVIKDLSLDRGPVYFLETESPEGYSELAPFVLHQNANGNLFITDEAGEPIGQNGPWLTGSLQTGLVLNIPNNSDTVSVTVNKYWNTNEAQRKEVTMQLLANGHAAASLYPSLANVSTVILNGDNGWSYTWQELPEYANGSKIRWSVRETRIGTEKIRDSGDFLNYLVYYDSATDGEGNVTLSVTNDIRRVMLRVTKTNEDGTLGLGGAVYRLDKLIQQENGGYEVDPDFISQQLTTDSRGLMVFEGIQYGRYRLTELEAPSGYWLGEPVELELLEGGAIEVYKGNASYNNVLYNLSIWDMALKCMPGTGSTSEAGFRVAGLGMLALLSAAWFLEKRRCRFTR